MKKKLAELFMQIIPVMIGVYLGFVVSNFSENRNKKNQTKILINSVLSEVEDNKKRLENVIDYHIMIRDSSRHYSQDAANLRRANFFKGTRISKLSSSAFNTGVQTGIINELPIDKIQEINKLYTFQDDYNEFGNLIMASLINKDFSDNAEDMKKIARFLSLTMTDIAIKEKELLLGYETILKSLKQIN